MTSTSTDRRFGVNSGVAMKAPVRVATTANIALTGLQTVDGVALAQDDAVLVKNQTTGEDNGIWLADTGVWTRRTDFNGSYDAVKGTMVRVNEGSENADGLFILTTDAPVIGTSSLTFSRLAVNYVVADTQTATAGQTVFNLNISYQVGSSNLAVYVNGLRQRITSDFLETTSSRITFTYALQVGDEVDCYAGLAIGNLVASAGSTVSLTDAGDFYVGTTVEAVFQEIRDAITPDNGDANASLTYNSSTPVQRWNTALTANRSVTLNTTNAKEGAHFVIVRGSGATGNFSIAVGSVATLYAPGEWCEVRYDEGIAAWILEKYGFLPTGERRGITADNGDTSVSLTVGSSFTEQRWATTLTADRTASLQSTGAWAGARFRVVRDEAAGGAFSLIVSGTAQLIRLAPGQWADFAHTGSAWILIGFGSSRPGLTSVVELKDDFVGEEIDGYRWQSLIGTDAECLQAIVLADQIGGVARLTTGDDAAATMAVNGAQLQSQLNWRANRGGMVWEGRVALSAITSVALFIGLTDQRALLEMPFTLGAGDALTSNATDAVGVLFDTGADTDNWWLVGVAADVDAAKQNTAVAPVAGTFETWRIEVSATGVATFYRNGSLIGSAMTAALTPSAGLTPVIAAFSRGAASRTIDVDFIAAQAQR